MEVPGSAKRSSLYNTELTALIKSFIVEAPALSERETVIVSLSAEIWTILAKHESLQILL
jgi:hypothetical protein